MPYEDEKKPSYMRTAWGTPEKKEDETAARTEFVTLPTEEELAAQPGYMKPVWQNGTVVQDRSLMPTAPQDTGEGDVIVPKKTLPSDGLMKGLFDDAYLMSSEEAQRRMRSAHTASMIGNLGNVMSAFANLYYVNKGAPSQKTPEAVMPDYMKFADRVSQARKNAAAQKLALEKLKDDKENKSLELRMKQLEMDMKRPVYEAQARSYDALVLQRQAAAAYNEARIAIQQGNYELAQKKLEEAERHNRAVEAIQGMNANTNATRLGWQMQPEYTETTVDKSDYDKETRTVTKRRGQQVSGGGSSASSQGGKNNQGKPKVQTRGSLLPKK